MNMRAPNVMPTPRPIWVDLESEEEEEGDRVLVGTLLLLAEDGIELEGKGVAMGRKKKSVRMIWVGMKFWKYLFSKWRKCSFLK